MAGALAVPSQSETVPEILTKCPRCEIESVLTFSSMASYLSFRFALLEEGNRLICQNCSLPMNEVTALGDSAGATHAQEPDRRSYIQIPPIGFKG
jgi:hypothetical protein